MERSVLRELVMLPTPSGFEFLASQKLKEITGNPEISCDPLGNYYIWCAPKSNGNKPKIMISAHLDEIGAVITGETSEGLWRIGRRGGIDPKVLEGQVVWCYPDPIGKPDVKITGVIGKTAIHLEEQEARKKADELTDIYVDFGILQDSEKPCIGAPVVPEKHYIDLPGDFVCAPGLDDKAGIWVVLDVLDKIQEHIRNDRKGKPLDYDLVFVLCSQEEVGLRGANVAAQRIKPDISIDLDVSFAVDEGRGGNKIPAGSVKLGGGPLLSYGPDKDFRLMKELSGFSDKFQEQATSAGGTNTSILQLNSGGCKAALVSIPQRNMHTPVEICSWDDIEGCSKMIIGYLKNLKF